MPTAVAEDTLVELTLAYIEQVTLVSEVVGGILRQIFESLESVDRADIATFAREASSVANAGRAEAAELTSGYLAELTGQVGVIELGEAAVAFEQPFLRMWHNLKEGQQWEDARAGAASEAQALGHDYTMDSAAEAMSKPGVKVRGFRRVIAPGACEWCRVVATKVYNSAQAAAFGTHTDEQGRGHHNCRCTVVAIGDKLDPGKAINAARLRELKASGAVQRTSESRARARERERASGQSARAKSQATRRAADTTSSAVQDTLNM